MKRGTRRRSTFLKIGDTVSVRIMDVWYTGNVSRSIARGKEVDVRLLDGRVMKSITSEDVKSI
jgi:predicted RNA-binding protein with RPS1 domain